MEEPKFSNLILSLIFLFLFFKILNIFKKKKTSKSNNYILPPSPPYSLPILGHLLLLKPPLHETLLNLSKKYGPIMLLNFGSRKMVVVTSTPSIVEDCFTKTNDIGLANRAFLPSQKDLNYNFTTMGSAPYGHLWRSLRRVMTSELLSATRLDATTDLREQEVKYMCKKLLNESSSFHKVELKSWFRDLLNNITTMSMIGKRYYRNVIDTNTSTDTDDINYQSMIEELFKLFHTPNPGDFLPVLRRLGFRGTENKMTRLMKRVDEFLEKVIMDRKKSCESHSDNSSSRIVVDRLFALQDAQPELYTDEIIKGLILIMLIAGTETPYLTLEWAMTLLLNNPNAIKEIKNEINIHVGSERLIQENDLDKLPYLQNVINECLRLYPTLPLLIPREASQDINIGGYDVPRGTMLMVNAWAIHRDPLLWESPNEFNPERFEEKKSSEDKYKMLAFSSGRRGCPGTNLGYRIIGLTLGTLIQAFDWEKSGDEKIDMTAFYGLSMSKLKPLEALCKPCSNMKQFFL